VAVITINADYDDEVEKMLVGWFCLLGATSIRTGKTGSGAAYTRYRGAIRFPLGALPAGSTVTQVRLKVYCRVAGGATHLLDIHAYNTNGQSDPEADAGGGVFCDVVYARCASGNLYNNDDTSLRTTGTKWFILGGTVCTDVQNAKTAVNRFSLGLHEEGDDEDPPAEIDTMETVGGTPAQLEITYTVPLRNIGLHPSKVLPLIIDE